MRILSTLFSLAYAALFGVPAILLGLWTGLTLYKVERGFEWALWAANNSPVPLTVHPLELANDLIQDQSLIAAGISAAILGLTAFSSFRSARQALGPAGSSDDGKARIELKSASPRVGQPLEGRLLLARDAEAGEKFHVTLICEHTERSGEKNQSVTDFYERVEVTAVRGAHGWNLPFRFEIPVTAPPSGSSNFLTRPAHRWELRFSPSKAFISFPSRIALEIGAATPGEIQAADDRETPAR